MNLYRRIWTLLQRGNLSSQSAESTLSDQSNQSDEKFRRLLETAPGAILLVNEAGGIVLVNESARLLFGYEREQMLRMTVEQLIPERYNRVHKHHRQSFVENPSARPMGQGRDLAGKHRDGHEFPVEVGLSHIQTDEGLLVFAFVTDISERKQNEMALIESEERFVRIFNNSPVATTISRVADSRIISVNRSMERLTGFTRSELIDRKLDDYDLFGDPQVKSSFAQLIDTAGDENYSENQILTKSGIWRDVLVSTVSIDLKGEEHLITMAHDITLRKRAETALFESEEKLRLFIDHAPAALAMFDLAMRYVAVSSRWVRNFELEGQDVIGRSHYEVFPDVPERWREIHRRALNGESLRSDEDKFERAEGRVYWVRWEVHPWYIRKDLIGGIVIFSEDITEHKLAGEVQEEHERLVSMLKNEQEWNASIQRMIKVFSHELRNPLAVIQSSVDMLTHYHDRLDVDRRAEKLKMIASKVSQMTNIIDDVVHVVQNLFQRDMFRPRDVDLEQACRIIVQELQASMGDKHRLVFHTDGRIKTVYADENLITRILINLLSNAIKYSPEGSEVRLEMRYEDGIVLLISDQGIGIAPDNLENIFDSFFRANEARKIQGTGLGLSIVRDCVEIYGGKISVQSTLGQGSTFRVWLPLGEKQPEPEQVA